MNASLAETHQEVRIPPGDVQPMVFVFGVWLLLSIATIAFVANFASNIPRADDWAFVSVLATETVPSTGWFLTQLDLNIQPAGRLVMWAFYALSGGHLKPAMLGGVVLLSVAALIVLLALRALRGSCSYHDSIIPLLILSPGHSESLLWYITAVQVSYCTALSLVALALAAVPTWHLTLRGRLGLVACVLLLPGFGSVGLALAAGFFITFVVLAIRSKICRLGTFLLVGAACVLAIEIALYLVSLDVATGKGKEKFSSVVDVLVAGTQAATMGFGLFMKRLWPATGIFVVGLCGAAGWAITTKLRSSDPQTRCQAVVGATLLATPVLVSLAIGAGRSLQGGLLGRYTLYTVQLPVVVYMVLATMAPRRYRDFLTFSVFFVVCSGLLFNVSSGLAHGKSLRQSDQALRNDVASGLPLTAIAARHENDWGTNFDQFLPAISSLKHHGTGFWASAQPDPPMDFHPVPSGFLAVAHGTKVGDWWKMDGREFELSITNDPPRHIYCVRMTYMLETNRPGASQILTTWTNRAGVMRTREDLVTFNTAMKRRNEVFVLWLDEEVSKVSIRPSAEPGRFKLVDLQLATPPSGSPR
jgi:hypothetical protein